ncbi:MAG: 4Fe-4S dicluster domain-containing protein [Phycisphaerales bacterium]|nr:4Fe-4S dicluster domain-containing protein [Phycisphaerales bacterium]MCB9864516.1 4Fe-4S dicluster domain-containing protein [Phycisphaerales bacterium]
MSDADKSSGSPHDRRAFFRQGFSRLMKPAAKYLESKLPGIAAPSTSRPLRPPGAMPEPDFLNTCYRCGSCADHCPADSISLLQVDDGRLKGTPSIDPTRRACVVCDELACMKVCPSGALKLVDRLQIRIGLAVWDAETCTRDVTAASPIGAATVDEVAALPSVDRNSPSEYSPATCTICADVCPYGADAIRIENGRVHVIDPRATGTGCTGCGVCQEQCPTRPGRAIRVLPYALK